MYKCLSYQTVTIENYKITPIRYNDRYDIMNWRNEQIYHLRQNNILTRENQDIYFDKVILNNFEQDKPDQILFSYTIKDECIGYGGLVHINWENKNSELSFIIKTEEEKNNFELHWTNFLKMIKLIAFNNLDLHKIFTYAFDLRPKLYIILEKNGFTEEARLKEHIFINGKYFDVVIHSNLKKNL